MEHFFPKDKLYKNMLNRQNEWIEKNKTRKIQIFIENYTITRIYWLKQDSTQNIKNKFTQI